VQEMVDPGTSWQSPDGPNTVEHLAGAGADGQLYEFSWTPSSEWQVVNVSAIAGIPEQKIAGRVLSWQTPDGPYTVEHLAAVTSEGDLLVFWWSPFADWQVVNVSEITGQKIAELVTISQIWDGTYNVERLRGTGPSGGLYGFSWTPSSDWQVVQVIPSPQTAPVIPEPPPVQPPKTDPPPKTVPPDQPRQPAGSVIGAYYFDANHASKPFDLTVQFTGTLVSASGAGDGQTSFSVPKTEKNIPPGYRRSVGFSVNNMRRGTWTVKAMPQGIGAPMTCQVNVPGIVYLNVSGGRTLVLSPKPMKKTRPLKSRLFPSFDTSLKITELCIKS
jgi:hypothetical protein